MLARTLLLSFSLLAAAEDSALDEPTRRRLANALSYVNLSVDDLDWDKRPIDDDFRLACVNETLDRPLALADRALRAEREFADDPVSAAKAAFAWMDLPAPRAHLEVTGGAAEWEDVPAEALEAMRTLLDAWHNAEALREASLAGLSPEGRKLVDEHGADLYVDDDAEDTSAGLLAAGKKVSIARLLEAELLLAQTAALVREKLAGLAGASWPSVKAELEGVTVAIGGPAADAQHATIVLDVGGNDTHIACAWVIDLAGCDVYRKCGRGSLQTALIVDLEGDDTYDGGDYAQGGAVFGASLHVDVEGDDRYDAMQCSLGAGVFGVGMLFDLAGDDGYRGWRFVQGFGGVRGIGVLSDVAGNDTYYAGGKFSHAPLLPENFQSLSQGFGFGLRGPSVSGGVGVLCDHAGNDVYSAEVFGQGASYWYALGVLADSAGHDKYNLYQYGQGSGIHLSPGVLFDRTGNDAYSCNNGVAQGCGHDWGTGLLWDLAGDDYYQGSGMTQGGANANAIGILIDRAGNDGYSGVRPEIQGWSFESRGTIGLGVLLDLGGTDKYTGEGKDGAAWTKSTMGVGLDCEEPVK